MISPAFQFYPSDWLSSESVSSLTLEEEGVYIRLLCYCWREGSIPADEEKLARLVGKGAVTTVIRVVIPLFEKDDNDPSRLVHSRLEKEREKQKVWAKKSSQGGKKSAAKRWGSSSKKQNKGGYNLVVTKPQPNGNSSSSSSSSNSNTPNDTLLKAGDLALEIYDLYPLKAERPKALEAILKAMKKNPTDFLRERTALYAKMVKEINYRYVPYAGKWFSRERYNDDPSTWIQYQDEGTPKQEALQLRIETHPANPEYKKHNPNCSPELKDEFANLLKKRTEVRLG